MPRQLKGHLRKAPPRRTYKLVLAGDLAGFHVTMGAMTGSDIIAIRSGELTEVEAVRLVADRAIEHDFDVDDLLTLDYWILSELLRAWGVAMQDAVIPPESGER